MKKSRFPQILVIGDTHDEPGLCKKRFRMAGQLAVKRQVDEIRFIGDVADFLSLLSYDSIAASQSDLMAEIISVQEAISEFMAPIIEYQNQQRKKKEKLWKPRIVIHEGNHEWRIFKFRKNSPQFAKLVPEDFLGLKRFNIEYVPYQGASPGIDESHGILFAHYFTTGAYAKAAGSGKMPGKSIAYLKYMPCVQGHNHKRHWHEELGRRVVSGLCVGKYFNRFMGYAGQDNDAWWCGLTILHILNSDTGFYDPEFLSYDRIEEMYG